MDRRIEPRFQVSSTAKIVLFAPERELDSSLLNISASGLLLLVTENLKLGDRTVVELEHHLILGEIQNSQIRGAKFAVGLKRIRTLEKMDLPSEATLAENIQTLLQGLPVAEVVESPEPQVEIAQAVQETPEETISPVARPAVPAWPKLPTPSSAHFAAILAPRR